MNQQLPKNLEITFERYLQHVPAKGDITLLVLKSHLLIEESLENILTTLIPNSHIFIKANFSFYKKAIIAQSMCWADGDSPVWDIIFAINSLRNELAHTLGSNKLHNKLNRVVQLSEKYTKFDSTSLKELDNADYGGS